MPATPLKPGLVSITFRQLDAADVLREVVDAGLAGIEWGGDVHVPHGDVATAERVGGATRSAGIEMPTYGSYFRAGLPAGGKNPAWFDVQATAEALGAGSVRVWAGRGGSAETDADQRAAVVAALRDACDRAADAGLGVSLEYHAKTLTDTADSCLDLLDAVDRPNLSTLWQTTNAAPDAESLDNLRRLHHRVSHAHVFNWDHGHEDQTLLAEGADRWSPFLTELALSGDASSPRFCLLEFVKGGDVGSFRRDAATLRRWLGDLPG